MIADSLHCAARRHKNKISKNQLLDKYESETYKIEHQTPVLSLFPSTTANGGIPKGSKLKNKKNLQERMDESKLHITSLLLEEKNNLKRLPVGTLHLLHNYVTTNNYFHETSFSIPVDKTRGRSKYGTTALKPGPLAVAYQIVPIILRYIQIKQECVHLIT